MPPDPAFPLSLTVQDKVCRIREILDRAGYTESNIRQLLDVTDIPVFRHRRQSLPLYLWRTRGGSPLEILVRLFLLCQPISVGDARRAVAPMLLENCVELGFWSLERDNVRATVELFPYQEFVLAADWPERIEAAVNPVMSVAASSRTLAQMTIRRHSTRTLDLGTGCGVLAFLAARHSDHVVAIDRNWRAVLLTQFNAQLNGLSNISCRARDFFEPVRDETFDLIVCNPPFVIAPGQGALHTHSGMPADQLCQSLIRTASTFLREGGYCQLLCNWVQPIGQDWRERLATWFEDTGCDAWILHSHSESAAEYALKRINETTDDPAHVGTQFTEWLAYYEREQIEAIGFGIITMQRSTHRANWFRCENLPEVIGPCGEAIEQGFLLREFLEAHREDRTLLDVRLRHAENLRWEQLHEITAKNWSPLRSQLQLVNGLAYRGNVETSVVEFVARCTGAVRLKDHVKRIAAASGQKIDRFTPSFLKVIRRLIELGCLLPVDE